MLHPKKINDLLSLYTTTHFLKKFLLLIVIGFSYLESSPNLHLVTYANIYNPNTYNLKVSAKKNGFKLKVLGMNTKMENFISRIKCIKAHLNDATYSDDDILLFVDAFDVVLLKNKKEILDLFLSFNHPIVFAAEKYCFPDGSLSSKYPKVSSLHCYLNAGGYIGYVGAIKEFFNQLDLDAFQDDQLLFSSYFVSHPNEAFVLDYGCKIFFCLQLVPEKDLEVDYKRKRIYYAPLKVFPAILHGNGNGKEIYELVAHWITKNGSLEMRNHFKEYKK